VPTTWAETLAGAVKIGPENPIGYAVGLSLSSNADTLAEFFCSAVISAGGKIFNDDGTAAVNSEAGVMTFEWLKDLFDKKGTSKATVNMVYNSVGDGLAAGTIAMTMLGSQRYIPTAARVAAGDVGVAPPPGWDAARPGQSNALIQTFMISKFSKRKEAALRFIDFMTGPATATNVAQGGEVPPRKSSYEAPYFATAEAAPIKQFQTILVARPSYVAYYPPRYWDMKQALASAAQSIVLQQTPPKVALDRAAKSYNSLIGK
jgi:multiple sugar transport system substrate-binding protein